MNGQVVANETNRTYIFLWRGYKACISSQLPKLSNTEVRRRFKLAMKFLKDNPESTTFKKPISQPLPPSSSSTQIPLESQELTQIPETQFQMEGK